MERLAREKIATQQRLAELKNDLSQWMDVIEIDRMLRQTVQPEEDQASTSTASGRLIVRLERSTWLCIQSHVMVTEFGTVLTQKMPLKRP